MSSNKTTYNSISAENVEDKDEVIQATTVSSNFEFALLCTCTHTAGRRS
jgi:hypothetical protein